MAGAHRAGLQTTGWTFAFLSPHSVRRGGVCLDELAIAIGENGFAITPILVEPIPPADLPPLPGHIQMLDFSAWREQGPLDGKRFAAWYAKPLETLKAILAEDRNARYTAEIAEVARRLTPPAATPAKHIHIAQQAEIARLTEGFVGRRWLLEQVEAWRRDPKRDPLLWLRADPGMGKSAFVAWLAATHRANVAALRICGYASEDRRDAGRIIRALVFQLARRLNDYRATLLRTVPADPKDLPANPDTLFESFVVAPLRAAIDGGRSADPFLIIVDGLDETVADGQSRITEILAGRARRAAQDFAEPGLGLLELPSGKRRSGGGGAASAAARLRKLLSHGLQFLTILVSRVT